MPTPETVIPPPPPPLIVEERLRLAHASLHCLRRLALLADEPHGVSFFADLQGFAKVVRGFAKAIEEHVRAVIAALPPQCTDRDAPDAKGGVR